MLQSFKKKTLCNFRKVLDMVSSDTRRINERIHQYWEDKKDGRAMPLEADIDPDEISDIWDSCFLVHVESGKDDQEFKYTYLGQSLIEAYGDDLNNKEVCEKLVYPSSMSLVHKFKEVITEQKPVIEDSEFTNTKGMLIKFRSCMLPLGKDSDSDVQYVIGGMKWKAF